MTGQSNLIMLAVVVVAFIAGYSIVSFVVRKWKEGPGHPSHKDQGRRDKEDE
jgi:flagellar basal body-associated protein FliL